MAINKEKYEQLILALCQALGGEVRGKKKLAKLLYFVDFDLFEKTEKSLTGDVYRALPMGPVPQALETMTEQMLKENVLAVETVEEHNGYLPTEVYRCLAAPDMSVFSTEEKSIIHRVVVKYGYLNGKQLEELSHAEAPYIGTEPKKDIAYELAFYRGTDFAEV